MIGEEEMFSEESSQDNDEVEVDENSNGNRNIEENRDRPGEDWKAAINNDNKNEIEKLMEENFIQTESNLRNFKAQKDVIEQSFHDETLRNEAIVDGLQKRIRKMEKHSILTLNSLSEYKDSPYLLSSKCVCTVVIGMIQFADYSIS